MNRHTFTAFAASLAVGVALLNLTPVLPQLRAFYGVSNARMGMLVTALVLTHSLVQVPSGLVVDTLGVRRGMLLALALAFLGSVLSIFSQDYGFLLAMRLLTGLGSGFSFIAGLQYALAHVREDNKLRVQAVFGGLVNTGSMIPFFTSPVLWNVDVRLIHLLLAFFFLVPLLAVWIWGEKSDKTAAFPKIRFGQTFRSGPVWTLGFGYALFFGGMMTIGTWITSYLLKNAAGSFWLPWIGMVGGVVIGVSAAGRFLGAWIPARISPRALILGALAVLAVSYGGLGIGGGLFSGVVLLGLAALMNSVTFGSVFYLAYQYAPAQSAGTTIGLVNFIASIGAFLFPIIFGTLLDLTGTFAIPFFFLSALAFLSLLRVFTLPAKPGNAVTTG